MATVISMPMLGETMQEGTVTKWLKKEGDSIEKGEPLLEVMTDKVNMEVESPASGVLRKIIVPENGTVPVQDPIAVVGTADESIDLPSGAAPAKEEAKPEEKKAEATPAVTESKLVTEGGRVVASPRARKYAEENGIDLSELEGMGTGPDGRIIEQDVITYKETVGHIHATPMARKLAAEYGLSLSAIQGTGPGGRITKEDVENAKAPAAAAPAAAPKAAPVEVEKIVLKGARKVIASRVLASKLEKPHVTLVGEVDMTDTIALRAQLAPAFEIKYGHKPTFNDFIVKAASMALAEPDFKMLNSTIEDDTISVYSAVNMGVAVSIEGGLIVPVISDAANKSLGKISVEARDLVNRARNNQLKPDEVSGGSFTISNLGSFGVQSFNPIITAPQTAILGVGAITKRAEVRNDQIVPRSMMNLCISFDHRVVDGALPAKFLQRVKEILETPILMLI